MAIRGFNPPISQVDIQKFPESTKLWFNQVNRYINIDPYQNLETFDQATLGHWVHQLNPLQHGYVLADCTFHSQNFTLSAASVKKRYHIKKIDNSVRTATIDIGFGSPDTIEGLTTLTLTNQYDSYTLYSDGKNTWYIESKTP